MHVRERTHAGAGRTALALWTAIWAGTALACAAAHPAPPASQQVGTYRLGSPDQLHVTILPEPAIERTLFVRPDGKISVDLIGDVQAAGRTTEEVAREIEQRIARYKRDARATVGVIFARSTEITVLGEVSSPTTLTVERETRIIEAIGRVGGATRFAAKSRVRVVRFDGNETQVFSVNLGAIERGDLRTNMLLAGGDLVVVPPTAFASVGYAVSAFFFPFRELLGFGGSVATTVVTGGASRAVGGF